MVEQTGHGVPKIVSVYGKEAFELADNHITVTIPFSFEPSMVQTNYDNLPKSHATVMTIIRRNPRFTIGEIAAAAGLSQARIGQIIADLKEMGKLVRKGGKRGGFWETN